jgi:hypothetical protein
MLSNGLVKRVYDWNVVHNHHPYWQALYSRMIIAGAGEAVIGIAIRLKRRIAPQMDTKKTGFIFPRGVEFV